MSITLDNVRVAGEGRYGQLFEGLSLHIEDGSRVGVLGTGKSGKTTLLRLICGTKEPDDGTVRRETRVSWPIPLSSFLVGDLTLARNARFIARLYGIDAEDFPRRIVDMIEMGAFLNTPLSECPRFARARLAFALGVGLDFDMYLFDGSLSPTDKPFKAKAQEIAAARVSGRGIVVATSVPAEVEQSCESVYVLEEGRASYFARTDEGVEHFKQLVAADKKRGKAGGAKPEEGGEEEGGMGDVDILGAAIADAID